MAATESKLEQQGQGGRGFQAEGSKHRSFQSNGLTVVTCMTTAEMRRLSLSFPTDKKEIRDSSGKELRRIKVPCACYKDVIAKPVILYSQSTQIKVN